MKYLNKIWKWIKEKPWAVVVAVGVAILAILMVLSDGNPVSSFNTAANLVKGKKDIKAKEAKIQQLTASGDAKQEEIDKVQKEITASKKRVLENYHETDLSDKSDATIADLFTRSGF